MYSRLAFITFIESRDGEVDNSLPGIPAYPSQGLPIPPAYPGQGLPHPPHFPSQGLPPFQGGPIQLPVWPFDPDQGPVDPPRPAHPIAPGSKFIVKWLACHGLVLVPDNSLPGSPATPDNTLPGGGASPKGR
jgi:hypothetical protein